MHPAQGGQSSLRPAFVQPPAGISGGTIWASGVNQSSHCRYMFMFMVTEVVLSMGDHAAQLIFAFGG
jgi:hypothetical protein